MNRLLSLAVMAMLGLASAHADVSVLPGIDGTYSVTTAGWGAQPTTPNGPWVNGAGDLNGGGSFDGFVTVGPTTYQTAFWCVDDQLYFSPPASGYADIIPLLNIATQSNLVRYSGVTNGGTPGWTNTTDGAQNSLPSGAQVRYEMAAWLVSQYNGGTNIMVPTATAQNTAIQDAIWAITDNNSSSAENGGAFYQISATPSVQGDPTTSDLYWVDQALQHYVAVDTSAWAVLSWQVDPNTGQISNSPDYNNGARQTFLVELDGGTVTTQNLAPEPGFYGALALGLSGLALSLNRRKKKS